MQLAGDVVHDDRTLLNTVFKYTNVWITAFISSAVVFYVFLSFSMKHVSVYI